MSKEAIGKVGKQVKMAAGLFWSDYGYLADTVKELEEGGADWVHLEMRDGVYMNFDVPRGGIDILTGIRPHTNLEIEVQLQMMRPTHNLFKQLADEGADLISLPIETTGETLIQSITYITETLGLKAGVWAWQGAPVLFFDQYIPFVDIIEYESRAPFWKPAKGGSSPHTVDPILVESIEELYQMLVKRGREKEVDLMEDGGLNAGNLEPFVKGGMSVGEFSSPLMKGKEGRLKPGTGQIKKATAHLRKVLTDLSQQYRAEDGSLK
jgi:ribulose-phosphate 3-epimerase